MSNFKIQGVGLDTTHLDYTPGESFEFDYLFTSITANNEGVIRDFSKYATLITHTDFLDRIDEAVSSHLALLGRDHIDLLLIDANCNFKKYVDTLNSCLDLGYVDSIGVYGPTNIEMMKEILEVLPGVKYIGLEFCPLNFNYELLTWASENNIDILGFNPFGGYISAPGIISSFSVPYLLGFAANYATLVFLSSRDMFTAMDDKLYLQALIDTESSDIYSLTKSISRLYKPIKSAIGVSLILDADHTLPLGNQGGIFNPSELVINMGDSKTYVSDLNIVIGSLEDSVYEFYKNFKTPEDTDSDLAILALIKPGIINIIQETYSPESGWHTSTSKIGEKIFIINVTKPVIKGKWIFKRLKETKSHNFLVSVNEKSLEFCELGSETA